ncbi:hypothetical protein AAVH_11497 [Aphelenchoides avenae]|nr:hypothetical protein AAVH_11497 [Aphelenchus avenae]
MQIAASVIAIITLVASMAVTDGASSQGVAERAVYASAIALETVSTFIGALIATFVVYLFWHAGKCQKKADGYPF